MDRKLKWKRNRWMFSISTINPVGNLPKTKNMTTTMTQHSTVVYATYFKIYLKKN